MRLVIDAQIVHAFYCEDVLEREPQYSGSAVDLFDRLDGRDTGYLDEDGHIETEWRALVQPEWFEAWFGDQLQRGCLEYIAVENCAGCIRLLRQRHGFPGGRDTWYIRAAAGVRRTYGAPVAIVSEDMDLHEPRSRGAADRAAILDRCSGAVARHLERRENISVRCISRYLADF